VTPEVLLFSLFSSLSVATACGMVFLRDPVKSALSLIVCFFSLACLYLLQSAELIAVLQILVYAGAIMVLFVFVIMLVENKQDPIFAQALSQRFGVPIKFGAVALVAGSVLLLIYQTELAPPRELPEGFGGVRAIGLRFFDGFLFHFEYTSVLLLAGIVGAVVVSKRRRRAR
jgi:NADH-quinone oxidoreductase subunit J